MAEILLSTNSSTNVALQNEGDMLVVETGVNLSVDTDAIDAALGWVNVTLEGAVFATNVGFADRSDAGDDTILVGQAGSLFGASDGIVILIGGDNHITNNGVISGGFNGISALSSQNTIFNSGTIEGGAEAIALGGQSVVVNTGLIAQTTSGASTTLEFALASNQLTNSGVIASEGTQIGVDFEAGADTIDNSGALEGAQTAIHIVGAEDSLTNSGKISSVGADIVVDASTGGVNFNNSGTILTSGVNGNVLDISGGGDTIFNSGLLGGGIEVTLAATASTLVNHGIIEGGVSFTDRVASVSARPEAAASYSLSLTNTDIIDGAVLISNGAAYVSNTGIFKDGLAFTDGDDTFLNRGEVLGSVLLGGSDDFYNGTAGSVSGDIILSGTSGKFIGGADASTFVLQSALTSNDIIHGGSAYDTLELGVAGTYAASAFKHVSGISILDLANGSNNVTINSALVGSAHKTKLTVNGGTGHDTINAAGVAAGDTVVIDGGAGADVISAGAANFRFVYNAATDSQSTAFDAISGVNFADDVFDLGPSVGTVSAIDAPLSGALSTSSFNTTLTAELTSALFAAHSAVLFTATSGSLSGSTFLIVDPTSTAGYHAATDLVIRTNGASGTLSVNNFV